jgi:hypothetical protein
VVVTLACLTFAPTSSGLRACVDEPRRRRVAQVRERRAAVPRAFASISLGETTGHYACVQR